MNLRRSNGKHYVVPEYLQSHPYLNFGRQFPIDTAPSVSFTGFGPALIIDGDGVNYPEQAYQVFESPSHIMLLTHVARAADDVRVVKNKNPDPKEREWHPYVRELATNRNKLFLKEGENFVKTRHLMIGKRSGLPERGFIYDNVIQGEKRYIPPSNFYFDAEGVDELVGDASAPRAFSRRGRDNVPYLSSDESEVLTWCTHTYHANDAIYLLNEIPSIMTAIRLDDQSIPGFFSQRGFGAGSTSFMTHAFGKIPYAGSSAPVRRSAHSVNQFMLSLSMKGRAGLKEAHKLRPVLEAILEGHALHEKHRAEERRKAAA